MRDNDKSKAYQAEFAARALMADPGVQVTIGGVTMVAPDERRFARVEDIQSYVDKVLAHIGSDKPVSVRVRKGTKKAHYERWTQTIAIPESDNWAMREVVVLHELAHHLTPLGCEAHGSEFRATFCDLLERVLSPEARFIMQVSFWSEGLTA